MGDLAAFVGRNESGKTTILQALTLLNRTESVSDLDLCDEMNEELKSEINIVEGEFELTKKEVSLIKEKFPNLPDIGRVKIIRTNKQDDPVYDFGGLDVSDDANEEINSFGIMIHGKNKKSAPAKKTKPAKVAPTSKSASKKKPHR